MYINFIQILNCSEIIEVLKVLYLPPRGYHLPKASLLSPQGTVRLFAN